jgi:hypothetical protein
MELLRVGVVGYSGQKFNEKVAVAMLENAFARLDYEYDPEHIEIVSGLTNLGIPKLSYEVATSLGYLTRGVACALANDYPCFDCDVVEIIGENWGDESEHFLDTIDVLVRIGGGKQTMAETNIAKERGIAIIEFDLEPL